MSVFQKFSAFIFVLSTLTCLISCEGDIENVGSGIVDNGSFEGEQLISEVIAYNENVQSRIANKNSEYLLGVYNTSDFGLLQGSIVSQLGFEDQIDFGTDPKIDTVLVNINYHAFESASSIYGFELDSVYGNRSVPFQLDVYELDTYLNVLDPSNPSEELNYFTNDVFAKSTLLRSGEFKVTAADTAVFVHRKEIPTEDGGYVIDTIQNAATSPFISLTLDSDYFENNFFTNPDAFLSNSAFVQFFKGLYIEATPLSDPNSHLISLNLKDASMIVYYTNTTQDGEGNDVRTKQQAEFKLGGVTNALHTRDYSGSNAEPFLNAPNQTLGDQKLYTHGATGAMAILELFKSDDLSVLRADGKLINNANIVFYIDQDTDLSNVPFRVLLYNYDTGEQLPDLLFEGLSTYGGALEYDSSGKPYRYKINVTDYISNILKPEDQDPEAPAKLALKVMNTSDFPTSATDSEVENFNWSTKGVVIHGNQSPNQDLRVKLEISYTVVNN